MKLVYFSTVICFPVGAWKPFSEPYAEKGVMGRAGYTEVLMDTYRTRWWIHQYWSRTEAGKELLQSALCYWVSLS